MTFMAANLRVEMHKMAAMPSSQNRRAFKQTIL
jgi:hypothetical protein